MRVRLPAAAVAATTICVFSAVASSGRAAEPLPTTEIAPGVFVYQAPYQLLAPSNDGAIANVGFIVGKEAVAVVDTGNTREAGERLLAAVRTKTDLPIRYVINTHMHPDHALGDVAFKPTGVKFVAHAKFARALQARAQAYLDGAKRALGDGYQGKVEDLVTPDIEVAPGEPRSLDLGGRTLELEAMPTAHTDNDLTVRDLATDSWFLGDLLFMGHLPSIDGSFEGWVRLMAKLRDRKAARVVPGHGPASANWPDAMAPQQKYFDRLRSDVEALLASGATLRQASEKAGLSEREAWALFDEFNARNAIEAYREAEWR
ncbi:quinoprotein relay system zinc metallohydrolase 2 [Chelatococcus sambhunathii]|uniref:Quinoprotein relay system zinc metallohydrolase 2 n=1 Tax=Chelatococcus sambhunathii TaxID=363953 RepID=A0ABU1DIL3_9HYPH|nr:quinoprotein relay system zinc metallohydrolase 2 [Chelatococcus sambhunathii]MDR4307834.1 quinoprotein relay system zinc metallohydrolase 2 [Chelatococcus sambhunathii]